MTKALGEQLQDCHYRSSKYSCLATSQSSCSENFAARTTAVEHWSCLCRLPNQAINVTIDPLNFGLVHTISKYLEELAPGWKLGPGYSTQWPQWPPCVSLDMSAANNQSRHFETPYAFG